MKYFLWLLISLCSSVAHAGRVTLVGEVVSVSDGDTVTLLDSDHTLTKIRLAQIDAPEISHGAKKPGQPFGQNSKQSLVELVFRKQVTAECETKDRYSRQVCKILVNGQDVNLEQVRRGMAWVYRKYAHEQPYFQTEDEARQSGRGLWSDEHRIEPWLWRQVKTD